MAAETPCRVCNHREHGRDACHEVQPNDREYEVDFCACTGRTALDVIVEESEARRARIDELTLEVASLRALAALHDAPPLAELLDPGRAAFDAYRLARGGTNHDGTPTPTWEQLGDGVRAGWVAASVGAVAALVPTFTAQKDELEGARLRIADLAGQLAHREEDNAGLLKAVGDERERVAQLERDLVAERATPPGSKLAVERKKREHFRCEMAALRRWADEPGRLIDARGTPYSPPTALDLFAMYPALAPQEA